jgi:hypothetical protein
MAPRACLAPKRTVLLVPVEELPQCRHLLREWLPFDPLQCHIVEESHSLHRHQLSLDGISRSKRPGHWFKHRRGVGVGWGLENSTSR